MKLHERQSFFYRFVQNYGFALLDAAINDLTDYC